MMALIRVILFAFATSTSLSLLPQAVPQAYAWGDSDELQQFFKKSKNKSKTSSRRRQRDTIIPPAVKMVLKKPEEHNAEKSVALWQRYFPDADCKKNDCGKDIPHYALESFLKKAEHYRPAKLHNHNYFFIADFNQHSSRYRGYLVYRPTGKVEQRYLVSHGKNSDLDRDGYVDNFSNVKGSNASSKGLYEAGKKLPSVWGKASQKYKVRLFGLEEENSNADNRDVVVHGHQKVNYDIVQRYGKLTMSAGCPMVDDDLIVDLVDKLKGSKGEKGDRGGSGSLYYIHFSR